MTVGTKMHQTLASLESVAANMKTFALETENKAAQQMYAQYAQQLDTIHQGLKARCDFIEQEEPQYKVFENMQKGGSSRQESQMSGMHKSKLQ